MFWIEGLARTSNGFALEMLNRNGIRAQETLAGLSSRQLKGKTSRIRINTDFRAWSAGSPLPFWELLGIGSFKPRNDHQVFKVVHEGIEYLIPAGVLMAALIRPIRHMHPYLFRPQGLDLVSIPLLDRLRPTVDFYFPAHRVTGNDRMTTEGVLASHSWMHCFPSARKMWDSVYQAAQSGRIDIALPRASVSAILHSVAWMGVKLVTNMSITVLHAEEAPFDFAASHSRNIVFHESASMDWAYEHQAKAPLPIRDGGWSLSNDEWFLLAPKIQKKRTRKHDLRRIIDLILFKLGTGKAWRKLDFKDLNFSIVLATYQHMQRDGRWELLEETLKSTRGTDNCPKVSIT